MPDVRDGDQAAGASVPQHLLLPALSARLKAWGRLTMPASEKSEPPHVGCYAGAVAGIGPPRASGSHLHLPGGITCGNWKAGARGVNLPVAARVT